MHLQEKQKEMIKEMFESGMENGEVNMFFPLVSPVVIRALRTKLEIGKVSKNEVAIKKCINRFLEENPNLPEEKLDKIYLFANNVMKIKRGRIRETISKHPKNHSEKPADDVDLER